MNKNFMKNKTNFLIVMQSIFIVVISMLLFSGCTDTIEGEVNENMKPIIQFVNIPPDGHQFSRNPEVYWIGNDPDGLIDFYRYHVALESEVGTSLADIKRYADSSINTIVLDSSYWLICDTSLHPGCTDSSEVTASDTLVLLYVDSSMSPLDSSYWLHCDTSLLSGCTDSIEVTASDTLVRLSVDTTSDWIQIDIDQNIADPHTTNIIPLTADTSNPVSAPIPQYVFIQAFDREGTGSDIKWRKFSRNDNPPDTKIYNIANDIPFVNSIFTDGKAGVITGVRLHWEGSDRRDYDDIGLTPPPFDYEWRLFGPYSEETINYINNNLIEEVFVTVDAQIKHLDDKFITCSSVDQGQGPVEVCDTTTFDSLFFADSASTTARYTKQRILDIDDTLISTMLMQSSFNGVDEWVQNEYDTLFNVFGNTAPDTTIELSFIFWVRSRDDAFVKDLAPEFVSFPVINPMYERDIAVIDFTPRTTATLNHVRYKHIDTSKAFWHNTIHNWAAETNQSIQFDTSYFTFEEDSNLVNKTGIDYIWTVWYNSGIPLRILLKHKTLILYNENHSQSGFADANRINFPEILSAMDAKINVWATWRNPLKVDLLNLDLVQHINPPAAYKTYFGVEMMTFTNWITKALVLPPGDPATGIRNEDFVGTYSIDEEQWPSIDIDTSLLHSRFSWPTNLLFAPTLGWRDTVAALPEVNWAARSFGTEVMYLYKSKYGANHPLRLEFEGSPVGHRFETSLFKSVHFNFTLLSMDSTDVQKIANNVLTWLYDPSLSGAPAFDENRYENAKVKISLDEARERYGRRLIEQAELRLKQANQ